MEKCLLFSLFVAERVKIYWRLTAIKRRGSGEEKRVEEEEEEMKFLWINELCGNASVWWIKRWKSWGKITTLVSVMYASVCIWTSPISSILSQHTKVHRASSKRTVNVCIGTTTYVHQKVYEFLGKSIRLNNMYVCTCICMFMRVSFALAFLYTYVCVSTPLLQWCRPRSNGVFVVVGNCWNPSVQYTLFSVNYFKNIFGKFLNLRLL